MLWSDEYTLETGHGLQDSTLKFTDRMTAKQTEDFNELRIKVLHSQKNRQTNGIAVLIVTAILIFISYLCFGFDTRFIFSSITFFTVGGSIAFLEIRFYKQGIKYIDAKRQLIKTDPTHWVKVFNSVKEWIIAEERKEHPEITEEEIRSKYYLFQAL